MVPVVEIIMIIANAGAFVGLIQFYSSAVTLLYLTMCSVNSTTEIVLSIVSAPSFYLPINGLLAILTALIRYKREFVGCFGDPDHLIFDKGNNPAYIQKPVGDIMSYYVLYMVAMSLVTTAHSFVKTEDHTLQHEREIQYLKQIKTVRPKRE